MELPRELMPFRDRIVRLCDPLNTLDMKSPWETAVASCRVD
jgi:hypothetical protein